MARYRLDKEPGIAQLVLERILITFFLDFDCFQAIDFIDSNSWAEPKTSRIQVREPNC